MSKYIAAIPLSSITRLALVEAGGRSMAQVKEALGCQYIINSWFYNMSTGKPVGNLCIDGTVKARASWAGYGLTWDEGPDIRMEVVPGAKAGRSYLSGVELLTPTRGPEEPASYSAEYGGRRGRSAAMLAGDYLILYCSGDGTADAKTPDEMRDELVELGGQYASTASLRALGLDSGGGAARLLLSLTVCLAQAVWMPRGGYWFQGTVIGTVYHNTTYIMLAPFALGEDAFQQGRGGGARWLTVVGTHIDGGRRGIGGQHAQRQMPLPEKEHVTDGAHGAEAAALGQDAHHEARRQREEHGRMYGAGAFEGIEEHAALVLSLHLRIEQEQGQQGQHDAGQDKPAHLALALAAAQREALAEEERADAHADDQTGQTEKRVGVPAGEPHDDAPRAAQKDQRADGRHHAQQQADDGRGAAARPVFAAKQGRAQRAQHHAEDLRPQVLDDGRAVQADGPGDVAVEAGDADAHVAGIAHALQQDGQRAQDEPCADHARRGGEEVGTGFHDTPL